MRTLLNIIWLLFGGVWFWFGYMFLEIIAYIFIVTIPAGIASFRTASYVLWPFDKRVVDMSNAGAGLALMNIAWFFVAGLWLVFGHVMTALAQLIMIIGIPATITNTKMIPITCFPFGKMAVTDPKAIVRLDKDLATGREESRVEEKSGELRGDRGD